MQKSIGLTGGIGSGKTTIANYLASLGIPVYIADDAGKKVMQQQEIIKAIQQKFGSDIVKENQLNRARLAEIVFNNPDRLKELNAIVHPAVRKDYKKWLAEHTDAPFLVYESAILFESGSYKDFDYVITITAPLEVRVSRVLQRDDTEREQVMKRINAQWTDDQRVSKSDFVIENIDIDLAKSEINKILKIL
ncbi:dephospho-CoA kinase [Flavobacterium flevense]|uniref:Dephospho-CoA kinase n=1 Tax=Flavobacterium flevense TaxID=983 RepID=A0A4Y4B1C4_9FLAO|nr:dephospho-CoA kinase [Flavobacterium flevense]GEC72897.1 dephospho-CoA kinase [Flavobacterium flevense]SHL59840.1 dephospho-CoA kinase [Flavobacterium flevense]